MAWGMIVAKFRPDRWDIIGAIIYPIGGVSISIRPVVCQGIR
ncbi:MAG TPA: hypothetical protein PLF56_00535 [Micropruina sp.]|nr:hypothetical protein [Micropruina sp.]